MDIFVDWSGWSLEPALALLAAHLLGDFVLQTDGMALRKRHGRVLALHAGVVAAVSYLLVGRWLWWEVPVAIWVSHAAIDAVKARVRQPGVTALVLDQGAHLAVIVALVALLPAERIEPASMWGRVFGEGLMATWVLVAGAVICVRLGGMLIGYWVRPYLEEIRQTAVNPTMPPTRGLTNGGRAIGQWERALVFLFILGGQPAAIGFLIAAKSIFRFGELKDRENRMEAEYITIGTLMSFGWALAISYLTVWAMARV